MKRSVVVFVAATLLWAYGRTNAGVINDAASDFRVSPNQGDNSGTNRWQCLYIVNGVRDGGAGYVAMSSFTAPFHGVAAFQGWDNNPFDIEPCVFKNTSSSPQTGFGNDPFPVWRWSPIRPSMISRRFVGSVHGAERWISRAAWWT